MFFKRTQAQSSFEIKDIKGVDILLQIPYSIYSLFITSVNFKITLMADKITAGFICESLERHLSTMTSATFGSCISI